LKLKKKTGFMSVRLAVSNLGAEDPANHEAVSRQESCRAM